MGYILASNNELIRIIILNKGYKKSKGPKINKLVIVSNKQPQFSIIN